MTHRLMSTLVVGLLLWVFTLSSERATAQAAAELDKIAGTLDDRFVLTISVFGSTKKAPVVPPIDGLAVQPMGVERQFSWGTGVQGGSEVRHRFMLTPTRAGVFVIPSVALEVNGNAVATAPLTLTVTEQEPAAAEGGRPAVAIEREFSNLSPYAGELVLVTHRFISRVEARAENGPATELPKGWRRFPIDGPKQYEQLIDGQRYSVSESFEVIIPAEAGSFAVPATSVRLRVRDGQAGAGGRGRRNRMLDDFFDHPFFGGGQMSGGWSEKVVRSEAVTLSVRAKPPAPKNDNGLVGAFVVRAHLSEQSMQLGDSLTVNLELSGRGFVDVPPEAKLPASPGSYKVYVDQPTTQHRFDQTNGGFQAQVRYKLAVMPVRAGVLALGKVSLGSAFNPTTGAYEELTADLEPVTVSPGQGGAPALAPPAAPAAAPDVPVAPDLAAGAPGQVAGRWDKDFTVLHRTTSAALLRLFALTAALPVVCIGVLLWSPLKRQLRRRRGRSEALRDFAAVTKRLLSDGQAPPATLATGLRRSLGEYLQRRFSLPPGLATPRGLAEFLSAKPSAPAGGPGHGVDQTLRELAEVNGWLEGSEFGGAGVGSDVRAAAERLKSLVEVVDQWRA